jgi:hypothetical protein
MFETTFNIISYIILLAVSFIGGHITRVHRETIALTQVTDKIYDKKIV